MGFLIYIGYELAIYNLMIDSMIINSFHNGHGPHWNRILYTLIMRRGHLSVSKRKEKNIKGSCCQFIFLRKVNKIKGPD